MRYSIIGGLGVIVIIVLSAAVAGPSVNAAVDAMISTDEVVQTTPSAPIILFEDDFATYSRRWTEAESPKASALYNEETFTITIASPGVSLWSVPDFDTPLNAYRIEVTALIHDGSADAQFGLILDSVDDDHFYAALIALDGAWQILQYDDGEWRDLTPAEASLLDDVIAQIPDEAVRLQVDVINDTTLIFSVNDQLLNTITFDSPLTGSVFGLIARAEHGFIAVAFDDMLVTVREDE